MATFEIIRLENQSFVSICGPDVSLESLCACFPSSLWKHTEVCVHSTGQLSWKRHHVVCAYLYSHYPSWLFLSVQGCQPVSTLLLSKKSTGSVCTQIAEQLGTCVVRVWGMVPDVWTAEPWMVMRWCFRKERRGGSRELMLAVTRHDFELLLIIE